MKPRRQLMLKPLLALTLALSRVCFGQGVQIAGFSYDAASGRIAYVRTGDDRRLVVLYETQGLRVDQQLDHAAYAPFWHGGKLWTLDTYGNLQRFSVGQSEIALEETRRVTSFAVRAVDFDPVRKVLYFIETAWKKGDGAQGKQLPQHVLVAFDLNSMKRLWSQRLDFPGKLSAYGKTVCVLTETGRRVFDSDTGEGSAPDN
jgi:hypothetical protein